MNEVRALIAVVFGAICFALLIACANVANLRMLLSEEGRMVAPALATGAVAPVACWIPARRASGIPPVEAIRSD